MRGQEELLMSNSNRLVPLLMCAALLASAGPVQAQSAATQTATTRTATTLTDTAAASAAEAARRDGGAEAPRPRRRHERAPLIGAVIGAAAAAAFTASLASAYGNNEGGGFCGACFVEWSAVTIPTGAGIGAGIGLAVRAIGNHRPSPQLAPGGAPRSPALDQGHGIALSVTF
jgi:hypothetical protein